MKHAKHKMPGGHMMPDKEMKGMMGDKMPPKKMPKPKKGRAK